jgi:ABC-type multidrug transport system ATPase subunit
VTAAVLTEPRVADTPPPAAPPAVRTYGLTKRFRGGQLAVNGIDLNVPHGSVYGFLGPNGSGKTTTIRMLLGLIAATDGRHELFGEPMPRAAAAVLPRVGALVEGPAFHPHLSGWANLERLDAADRGADPRTAKARIGLALERVGLTAAARKRYRAYSLGMRQRLGIAAALLQPRDLLVLDEPTNGLDPQGTREVRMLVGALAAEGVTVLLSSHLLSEVEQVCTYVGVMHVGRLVAQGPLEELRANQAARIKVQTSAPARAADLLRGLGLQDVRAEGTGASGSVGAVLGGFEAESVLSTLVHADVPVRQFTVDSPGLEEMFVTLTGEGFDVSG